MITTDKRCQCREKLAVKWVSNFVYKSYDMGPVEYFYCEKCKKNYYKPTDKEWWENVVSKVLRHEEKKSLLAKNSVIILAIAAGISLGFILVLTL